MEFKRVYSSLLDLFPQVDPRALKAVAIEHSKDAGAAILSVVEEIIPFFNEKSAPGTFVSAIANFQMDTIANLQKKDFPLVVKTVGLAQSSNVESGKRTPLGDADGVLNEPFYDACAPQKKDCPLVVETEGLAQSSNVDSGKRTPLGDADDMLNELLYDACAPQHGEVNGLSEPLYDACAPHREGEVNGLSEPFYDYDASARDNEGEVNIAESKSSEKTDASKMEISSGIHYCDMLELDAKLALSARLINLLGDPQSSGTVSGDKCPESGIKVSSDDVLLHILKTSQVDRSGSEETFSDDKEDVAGNSDVESHPESSFADDNDLVDESDLLTIDNVTVQPSETMQESNLDHSNASLSGTDSDQENMRNIVATEDQSDFNATMSPSCPIHTIDVIDEIIADARNHKKTLLSTMETVIGLVKQVEVKEKAAEQAKLEAERGGMDILFKVNELKQMLEYAKMGNDMDAGDVYGEKAILVTELKELQSRVFSLADEKNESLTVLEEMRQTLEVQLAAIEIEIKSAEKEKLEKESDARKLLADQGLVMEKVVQESKKLKQLAEENEKLQEFLTESGNAVDALQGEIAVICQDVRLLKEKFDLNLPLSESFFPSLTSFGLASSTSSLKSFVPDQVQALPVGDDDSIETQKNRDHEGEATNDDCKALEDDEGWELFEIVA